MTISDLLIGFAVWTMVSVVLGPVLGSLIAFGDHGDLPPADAKAMPLKRAA